MGNRDKRIPDTESFFIAMRLNELKINETAVINTVGGEGALRQHFLDMGVIPGA
ncbi:MAG: ferrous iron transport protein A, partial [Lachnospiraceae bacterium]|nr:ferrous iron transport protein A [Lachnospiraceae bacterium]